MKENNVSAEPVVAPAKPSVLEPSAREKELEATLRDLLRMVDEWATLFQRLGIQVKEETALRTARAMVGKVKP